MAVSVRRTGDVFDTNKYNITNNLVFFILYRLKLGSYGREVSFAVELFQIEVLKGLVDA
jgi:hypothetical protein